MLRSVTGLDVPSMNRNVASTLAGDVSQFTKPNQQSHLQSGLLMRDYLIQQHLVDATDSVTASSKEVIEL